MSITVIKLGGSLMHSSELSSCLETIQSLATMSNIIIVPGGGEFADKVREMQALLEFNDQTAHRLALLAMSQYGYLLAGMNQSLHVVEDLESLSSVLDKSMPLLWLPTTLLKDDSEISASWDYTSDSIALWLAIKLAASKLILLKAKVMNQKETSLNEHIDNGDLDQGFQSFVDKFPGEIHIINKSQFQDIERLILDKKT